MAAEVRDFPATVGRTNHSSAAEPRTATQYAECTERRPLRVSDIALGVLPAVPIKAPFPDVAVHFM